MRKEKCVTLSVLYIALFNFYQVRSQFSWGLNYCLKKVLFTPLLCDEIMDLASFSFKISIYMWQGERHFWNPEITKQKKLSTESDQNKYLGGFLDWKPANHNSEGWANKKLCGLKSSSYFPPLSRLTRFIYWRSSQPYTPQRPLRRFHFIFVQRRRRLFVYQQVGSCVRKGLKGWVNIESSSIDSSLKNDSFLSSFLPFFCQWMAVYAGGNIPIVKGDEPKNASSKKNL